MKISRLWELVNFISRVVLIDLNLSNNSFYIYPFSITGNKWILKKKKGDFLNINLRPGTTDFLVFKQMFVYEFYRLSRFARWEEIRQEYEETLRSKRIPLIIDCGANIGLSILYFRSMFPEALIIAVEPEEENFKMLVKNTNEFKALLLNAAISNKDGFVNLVNAGNGEDAFRTVDACKTSKKKIKCFTIPTLCKQARKFGKIHPFIIKVDIEGYEERLFSSSTGWIKLFRVLIIELHDWLLPGIACSNNFLKVISKENRDFIYVNENIFSINNSPQKKNVK